jgi:peptidoglycan/xylan/chitin deacetylase (PgdA/CDA1 family)
LKYSTLRPTFLQGIQIVFALLIIFSSGCSNKVENNQRAGIAISFDDHFISDWYALRPLFQKYDAKVTFFVTCGDTLTEDEVTKLKQLEKDGHEIGFHGTVHGKSTELIAAGPVKYAEAELTPGLNYMKLAGFTPESYAHPGGDHNDQVDSVLLASGFKILRDVAISRRKMFGVQLYALAPRFMNHIFYPFDKEKIVDALLIDTDAHLEVGEMQDAISKAKETGTALMLFGHQPLYATPKNGAYGFNVPFLEQILKEAQSQKLRFYTMSELPKN